MTTRTPGPFSCRPGPFGPGFGGGSKGPALLLIVMLLAVAGISTRAQGPATWKQSTYLKSSNAGNGDQLGLLTLPRFYVHHFKQP